MALVPTVTTVYKDNWDSVISFNRDTQVALQKIGSILLGAGAAPTFSSITLGGLTASRLLSTSAANVLTSTGLNNWVSGTAGEISVADDGDGTITLSLTGNMDEIAALTPTDSNVIVGNGTTWVAESGATARTSLGLGTTDSPEFTALVLTATSNPLYAGPWSGCPDPIEAHTNIYQSIYCGNDGANVGRARLGSNANGGFIQWNRYWDGAAPQTMDPAKSSWSLSLFGVTDNVVLQRSPAGSTTLSDVLVIRSTDRCLKNSGGGIFSGTLAAPNVLPTNTLGTESLTNPNLTSGTSWTATNDCALANSRAEFLYSGGAASTLTQASGTLAVAGVASRWYSFTYTTTSMLLLPTLTITTSFAESDVPLPTEAGTHTVYFRAAASPGDFVISATLTEGQRVYLDTFSLKEVVGTLEVGGAIRTNDKLNVAGADGVTQAASAGTVCDVTALAGGIATAQTQVTPIADGAHSLSGITSITTVNGRITAMA